MNIAIKCLQPLQDIGPNRMSQNESMLLDFQLWVLLMIKFDRDLLTFCLDNSFSVIGNDIDAKMDNKQDQLLCLSIFPFSHSNIEQHG